MWTVENQQPDIALNSAIAISWKPKLQQCTTASTTEAKYVAPSDEAKEALWLDWLAHSFRQVDSNSALVVYSDSQGVVALPKNPVHHNGSKRIDVRYHFVRDYIISGKIGLEMISTADNVADGMTKCLSQIVSDPFDTRWA